METVAIALTAGLAVFQGIAGKAAADAEAEQFEEQQRNAVLQARQDENIRRENLRRTLATQSALRAGRGVSLFSPTGQAIAARSTSDAEQNIRNAQINFLSQARNFGLQANQSRAQGNAALVGGLFKAGASVASGLSEGS